MQSHCGWHPHAELRISWEQPSVSVAAWLLLLLLLLLLLSASAPVAHLGDIGAKQDSV
jgi:hypothetical protein